MCWLSDTSPVRLTQGNLSQTEHVAGLLKIKIIEGEGSLFLFGLNMEAVEKGSAK